MKNCECRFCNAEIKQWLVEERETKRTICQFDGQNLDIGEKLVIAKVKEFKCPTCKRVLYKEKNDALKFLNGGQ